MVTDLARPADTGDGPATPPPHAPGPTLRYRAPLDGLRALAVMAVLAYHGDLVWARGGFIGVDVFFVLSGFLITGLILVDHQNYGRVRLGRFWRRRALRVLPALVVMLVGVSVAVPSWLPTRTGAWVTTCWRRWPM
ncbi:MAG: acyltransferase family protein [Acidimicrobiales bacterium]